MLQIFLSNWRVCYPMYLLLCCLALASILIFLNNPLFHNKPILVIPFKYHEQPIIVIPFKYHEQPILVIPFRYYEKPILVIPFKYHEKHILVIPFRYHGKTRKNQSKPLCSNKVVIVKM